MKLDTSEAFARECDAKDPLRAFRERFCFPRQASGEPFLYFAGNSLGLQPKRARDYVNQELEDWERLAVEGHLHARKPWLPYHEFLTPATARLVGAQESEVVVMNSLTVNLHLMLVSFYRPNAHRFKVLVERGPFPSDRYAIASHAKLHGLDPIKTIVEPREGQSVEDAIREHGAELALVLVGNVNYLSGEAYDVASVTRTGHEVGARVGFDFAHGAGNLVLRLHDWNVDFAVWCSYKYLNAGPGAIAGCFVHQRHHRGDLPRMEGWWGHDKEKRFLFQPSFSAIPTVEAWQLSNPPIFQLAALRASMELFDEAGMEVLRAKSLQLTAYLEAWLGQSNVLQQFTPRQPERRGCQLSVMVSNGRKVLEALKSRGVICDFREPGILRFAPTPLYNSFLDVYRLGTCLAETLRS